MIGDKPQSATGESDDLLVANRSHANFCENVPLALLMGAIVEMNGGDRKVLSGSFAALLLFRILHVELGLRSEGARGVGRPLGHFGTVGFTIGMAGYAAYLGKTDTDERASILKLTMDDSQRILGILNIWLHAIDYITVSRKRRNDDLHSCCIFGDVDICLGCYVPMPLYITEIHTMTYLILMLCHDFVTTSI